MSDFKLVKILGNPIQINLGGFNPDGEYDNGTSYNTGDSVSYGGSSYIAIQATTGNLPTDTAYWQLLAAGNLSFETVSKNLDGYPATLNYTLNKLTSVVYNTGAGTITKTLAYTGNKLTSITLSGDVPVGISTVKTLNYTGNDLTSFSYS